MHRLFLLCLHLSRKKKDLHYGDYRKKEKKKYNEMKLKYLDIQNFDVYLITARLFIPWEALIF